MEQNSKEGSAQIVYFSHGGCPLPILGDPGHKAMVDFMVALPRQPHKPDFILVISAHWEESVATLIGAEHPAHVLDDYYGFPAAAYQITYPAPGNPELASQVADLLMTNIFPARSTTSVASTMACSSHSS